jgi:16S rRNA (cytosine967-C5)-methyltransferase
VKISSLIGHVVELFDDVNSTRKPADHLIDTFFRKRKYLGSHDRRFIAETLYAALRHKRRIEWALSNVPEQPHRTVSFVVATLLFEKKYSVDRLNEEKMLSADLLQQISSAVAITPSHDNPADRISLVHSFPEWMVNRWFAQFGGTETEHLCGTLNTQAPITLRVNTLKTTVEECRSSLMKEGIDSVPTEFSPFGLHIPKRINVFQLETFRKGYFEVQDEGSQLLALLVDPKPRSKVIDACAGGGGKSLAMAAMMKNRGEIFSLDIHNFRLDELRKRIKRAGTDTIRVKTVLEDESPAEFHNEADYVLVDAPCSGTGTIRRNPGMKWTVTPLMVEELRHKQEKILTNYARCVKVNGTIVYATCSLMKEENEEVVESFLTANPDFVLRNPAEVLSRYHLDSLVNNRYFQLLPQQHGTDGFFAAIMRRVQ